MNRFATLLACVLAALPAYAQSKADLGRKSWSAFECSVLAELAGKRSEQERLFTVGLTSGREFIEALRNGEIQENDVRSSVPLLMLMRLGGPSTDFMIGRIYEAAVGTAYDDIVKKGDNGLELPIEKWRMDDELKKMRADLLYLRGNCSLIR